VDLREGAVEIRDECMAEVIPDALQKELAFKVAVFLRAREEV
jgi:hypothetical protein